MMMGHSWTVGLDLMNSLIGRSGLDVFGSTLAGDHMTDSVCHDFSAMVDKDKSESGPGPLSR